MSAWIVSKKHIDVLVAAAFEGNTIASATELRMQLDQAGQMLWAENHKSVNARYMEEKKTPPYTFASPDLINLTPAVILKSIRCYSYQSCEHDGWKKSKAFKFCKQLEESLQLPTTATSSPEYDAAPWGIE